MAALSSSDRTTSTRPQGLIPGWKWILLAAAAIVALSLGTELIADHAFANVAAVAGMVLGALGLVASYVFFGGAPKRSRRWVLGITVAMPVLFFTLFRLEGFSGELIPRFVFRFRSPSPRTAATSPANDASDSDAEAVDLATTTPNDFPHFLGPDRTNSVDQPRIARDWDMHPPEELWRAPIGEGWAGFAVVNGFAVTLDQQGELEQVTCREVATGQIRWTYEVPTRFEFIVAGIGPRTTPTIEGGRVYTFGATGHLACLDGATGKPLWAHDLLSLFGISAADEAANVRFGRANSPLIVDHLVIVPIGGPLAGPFVSLVAFDKLTGERVWTGGEHNASYSSPVLAELDGVRQVLIVNEDFVSGHDPKTGAQLWEFPWPGKSVGDANVSQVVSVGNNRLFISKGYFRGAALWEVNHLAKGDWEPREIWSNSQVLKTKFTNVVVQGGAVYGLSDGILECVDLATGKRLWKEGRYGHGQILGVGELLLILSEEGELLLLEPSPREKNKLLSRLPVLQGKTWNPLTVAGPYLLVRNSQEAACYRLPLDSE